MASLPINLANLVQNALALGAVQVREELQGLVDVLAYERIQHILEIGSEAGGTFYAWCQLASGMKISVDLPTGNSGSGRFSHPDRLEERTRWFESFAPDVHVITGDSHGAEVYRAVKALLGEEQLDFLFIDGDHSHAGVKMDFETYGRFVRPGGLIAFHDIKDTDHHRYRGCFVADFWKELKGDKESF
jgi:cephalosporin hydroxylase